MEIEDIAKMELFLRSKNGLENILDVENLIIASGDSNCVNKLKEGAYRLYSLDNEGPDEIKQTWQNLFTKQVRFSVNRAKQKK